MTEIIVGIDLGTTNSAVAYVKDGEPEIIPIDGQPTMPSCVGIDPAGKLIVGQPARNMLIAAPESTVLSIKRHMGEDVPVTMGGKSFSPEEISSFILRRLKTEAEKFLGQPVTKAVITVPAFFNEAQRKATQNAGALAELDVVRIINEPTAAALAYEAGHADDQRILVYDLGGGTFDVSVVVVEAGVVEVKASHGDTHLGGDDFDQLLVQHVVDEFHAKHGIFLNEDPKTMRRLKVVLERAKCRLSDEPFASIREEYIHDDLHLEIEINREDYEEMIRPYLLKTIDCIHQSMQDARLLPRDLSKVMLVGGATRTPLVHRLIEEKLGIVPRWEINPDLIVALGASISGSGLAGAKAKSILVDITSHTFGTAVVTGGFFDEHLGYAPIIHRNTPLPASKSDCFYTMTDHQPLVEVRVYEGEDLELDNNTLIGKFRIEGLSKVPAGSPILVNFTLDLNGMLMVTAIEKDTGLKKSVTLDTRNAQPSLDLEEARKNIESLINPGADSDDDDVFAPDEESAEAADAEPDAPAPPDHESLLRSAKDLRKRGEALLTQGIGQDDDAEIRGLLKQSAEAISARQWEELQDLNETLSDLIFYLED